MDYKDFEEQLRRYEEATVELVNLAPPGSPVAFQAIANLRVCQQLRVQLETEHPGATRRGRRLSDYYPEAQIDRHHTGSERRSGVDRRAFYSQ